MLPAIVENRSRNQDTGSFETACPSYPDLLLALSSGIRRQHHARQFGWIFRDDVNGADHGFAAIECGGRSMYDLDLFHQAQFKWKVLIQITRAVIDRVRHAVSVH